MKKKLLSEAQVRRFMGLAGINPLNEMATYMEEDEMEEGRSATPSPSVKPKKEAMHDDKEKNEALYEEEEAMEKEEPELDDKDEMMDMDGDGDADLDIDEEEIEIFKKAADTVAEMAAKLAGAAGDEMDDMDKDDMDMNKDDMDMDEELMEVDMELTEDEIVNEVARRVAKRIVEAKRAHKKMNEALGRKK